jgi:DNA-binding XRE family transcriptional regulator
MTMSNETEVYRHAARRFRLWRRWIGYGQAQFAEALGLSQKTYAAYEDGDRRQGWRGVLVRFQQTEDRTARGSVSIDWLFGDGDDDRPVTPAGEPIPKSYGARLRDLRDAANALSRKVDAAIEADDTGQVQQLHEEIAKLARDTDALEAENFAIP